MTPETNRLLNLSALLLLGLAGIMYGILLTLGGVGRESFWQIVTGLIIVIGGFLLVRFTGQQFRL